MYLFEWESPFIGAAHALDLMVFGNGLPLPILSGFSSYEKAAEFMRKAWVNFASSGNPSTEQFIWPSYKENKNTISISETPSVLRDPYTDESILLAKALNEDWKAAGL
jgi:carboxylesterase type B